MAVIIRADNGHAYFVSRTLSSRPRCSPRLPTFIDACALESMTAAAVTAEEFAEYELVCNACDAKDAEGACASAHDSCVCLSGSLLVGGGRRAGRGQSVMSRGVKTGPIVSRSGLANTSWSTCGGEDDFAFIYRIHYWLKGRGVEVYSGLHSGVLTSWNVLLLFYLSYSLMRMSRSTGSESSISPDMLAMRMGLFIWCELLLQCPCVEYKLVKSWTGSCTPRQRTTS
eukprot:2835783-Amphidinium_carterae.1